MGSRCHAPVCEVWPNMGEVQALVPRDAQHAQGDSRDEGSGPGLSLRPKGPKYPNIEYL